LGSEREIERHRRDRQRDQPQDGRDATQTEIRLRWRRAPAVDGGKQAAADLDPRRLSLGLADQTRGDIAIDLGELVGIDRSLGAATGFRGAAAQRPKHGKNRRDRHQREHKPQCHQAVPGRNGAILASADAPLYTTGGRCGN